MQECQWNIFSKFLFFLFFVLSISFVSITVTNAADSNGVDAHDQGHDDHGLGSHHGIEGAKLPLWTIIPFAGIL